MAIAIRNRWRRQQLDDELRKEVAPKNILMIGPTGVGKTGDRPAAGHAHRRRSSRSRRRSTPKVGYYGRDVESMVRELVENAIGLVREELERVEPEAKRRVEERLLDLLAPPRIRLTWASTRRSRPSDTSGRGRRCGRCSPGGEMENRKVEIAIEQKAHAMMIPGMGMEQMDVDFQGMFEKILPKNVLTREMTVAEARRVLFEQECEALINAEKVNAQAIELAENVGIIFVDEMDKVVASEGGRGADVSRQGVQRDLLPIVEGTTVNTRYGYVRRPTTCCSSPPGRFTRRSRAT